MPVSTPIAIREAIAYLYASKETMRDRAVDRLVEIGEPAIGLLMEVVQQQEVLDFEEHLPGVNYVLTQRRVLAREAAAQALGRIGEPAVNSLIEVLGHRQAEIRYAAMRALKRIGEAAVPALIEAVQSKDIHIREEATAALAGIRDARAVHALRDLLYRELEVFRKRRRRWHIAKSVQLVIGATVYFSFLAWSPHRLHQLGQFFFQILIGGWICADATVNIRRNTVAALRNTTDTRMVGAFAACLSDEDRTVRNVASDALKKLLPQVHIEDKQYVSAEEMNALIRALGKVDSKLTFAILKAFEQIGDEKALPTVERLAEPNSGVTDEVRRAAQECLPYLRMRAEEARQANTLLRASMPAVAVAPETLLRAAEGIAPVEANQLLRAQASADS